MYLLDIFIIMCKLLMALLASNPESPAKEKLLVGPEDRTPSERPPVPQKTRKPSRLGTLDVLPPEIRNQIYTHVLQAPEPIAIRPRRQWPSRVPFAKRYDTRAIHNAGKLKFTVEGTIDRQRRRLAVDKCVIIGLLRVSKAVGAEAAGILYRRNRFVFKDRAALMEFGKKVEALYAESLWDVPVKERKGELLLGFGEDSRPQGSRVVYSLLSVASVQHL